jgi:hypothetical protein
MILTDENRKTLKEPCAKATLSTTNPTLIGLIGLWSNRSFRSHRPAKSPSAQSDSVMRFKLRPSKLRTKHANSSTATLTQRYCTLHNVFKCYTLHTVFKWHRYYTLHNAFKCYTLHTVFKWHRYYTLHNVFKCYTLHTVFKWHRYYTLHNIFHCHIWYTLSLRTDVGFSYTYKIHIGE